MAKKRAKTADEPTTPAHEPDQQNTGSAACPRNELREDQTAQLVEVAPPAEPTIVQADATTLDVVQKRHISPSQLTMYFRCGEQYRRRYVEGERIPPGISAHKGKGMHKGAQVNYAQKVTTFRDLSRQDIIDAAVDAFDQACVTDGFVLTPEERARGEQAIVAEARDQTADFADAFARHQAALYQPIEVEQAVRVELPSAPRDLFGYIDLVAIDAQAIAAGQEITDAIPRSVIDFKTSGKAKPQSEADESIQLTYYAAAHHVRHGFPVKDVRLEVLISGAKGVRRQVLVSDRTQADLRAFVSRTNAMLAGIEAGVFTPAAPGSWWCAKKWCGYWSTCPYVNAERGGEAFDA